MILKSIKWRLQLWYGLILVAVLAGFGMTAYQLERNRILRRVDDELHRRFAILADALHQGHQPGRGRPPLFGPPPEQMPEDSPRPREIGPEDFILPPYAAGLFGTNQPEGFYFVIKSREGGKIASDGDLPTDGAAGAGLGSLTAATNTPPRSARPPAAWTRVGFREVFDRTPAGEVVLVGCSLQPELRDLLRTALNLMAVGVGVLLVGLAGGWWFVGRALRPIREISATAARISAGDLTQRINSAEAESELGQLAAVLNSTFARLETAFAQQKQFAADAAHELRTPVTVMLTQTQMALARERDAAAYKQAVEACQRAAQRMRKLIESLLELARFDSGQEVLNRLGFDFSKTVADCLELVRPLAGERRVKIISTLEPMSMTGDPGRLAQVVTNLLTNAIQYNKAEGEVRLNLSKEGGMAVLTIADTGQGIAAEDLPRVFERFYRADPSRTGAGNTGLGLSICKAIVEAHGGTIEVADTGETGTTFQARLPAGV